MNKPKNNSNAGTTTIDYRNKYSESTPKELNVSIPEDLVSGIEDYRQYLGECQSVNTSKNKIVEESIKDTLSSDCGFRSWREKKARESVQKNQSAASTNAEDDIDKKLEETFKINQNPPAKNTVGNTAQNGAAAGTGAVGASVTASSANTK